MSAQALLSVIAPSAPAAPQGSVDAGASDFKGLLSGIVAETDGADEATPDKAAPAPRGPALRTKAQDDPDASSGFLAMPAGLPAPQTAPLIAVAAAGSTPPPQDGESPDAAPAPPSPPMEAPVAPAESSAPPTGKVAAPDTGKGPAPDAAKAADAGKATDAVKSPPRSDQPLIEPPVSEIPVQDRKAAAAVTPATIPAEVVAAVAAARAAPPAPLTLPPAPPPLRPLAERTRLQTDAVPATSTGDGVGSTTSATAAASPAVSGPASGQPVTPVETAAAIGREAPAVDVIATDDPGQAPAPAEGGLAQTQAQTHAAAVHDASLSQISRATLDATAQIAAQIVRKLEGRSTRFEMALTPDDLGRVDVKLDIDADGRLNARLAFDNPLAATDLKGRADELRRQLQEAGFQLSDNALEFADRDSSSSAFDRGRGEGREGQNRAFAAAARLNAEIDVAQPPRWMALSLSPSGVDLKV